jgi:phage-related protein (TIGR01555 family)
MKVTSFGEKLKEIAVRFDGWSNPFTGLGTSRDKSTYARFGQSLRLSDKELDDLYHTDDMASLICDALPEAALRRGLSVEIADDQDLEAGINERLREIDAASKIQENAIWARVFGGCSLIPGVDDGNENLDEPLNEANIKSFTHINIVDKRYLIPLTWYTDPSSPKFGEPEKYLLTPSAVSGQQVYIKGSTEIHESRMIIMGGVMTSITQRQRNYGWQDSVLQRVYQTLRSFGTSWDSLSNLIQDANQAVFKMDGLIDALAANEEGVIQKRMQLVDMGRSVIRAIVLDADSEDFERKSFSWSGIEKPFELLIYRLAAAARMPITMLMGRSPAGMNATGESDFRIWYDRVQAYQRQEIAPVAERIARLLCLAEGKEYPTNAEITFPPLWEPTAKEIAETQETQSRADKNYIETAVLLPEEVAMSRFTDRGWSPNTAIDVDARPEPEPEGE